MDSHWQKFAKPFSTNLCSVQLHIQSINSVGFRSPEIVSPKKGPYWSLDKEIEMNILQEAWIIKLQTNPYSKADTLLRKNTLTHSKKKKIFNTSTQFQRLLFHIQVHNNQCSHNFNATTTCSKKVQPMNLQVNKVIKKAQVKFTIIHQVNCST